MSDHGFAPYDRKANLNTWLQRHGFLAMKARGDVSDVGDVDWTKTRAYALGLNLLYINLKGREVSGIVAPTDRDALVQTIKNELEQWQDPVTGERVVTQVTVPNAAAVHPDRIPDIIVGYGRGYRSSDVSAIGQLTKTVLEDNTDKWSGDHCMDRNAVPGLVASTLALDVTGEPSLVDLGPTILDYFDVATPSAIAGRSLHPKRSEHE
jgi:predicted AlkP superfamily phosphohydrolase/phosphomutase